MTEINVYINKSELDLQIGKYNVYFAGGHDVTISSKFNIKIQNRENNSLIDLNNTYPIRGYKNGQKTIKYYEFEIKESGIYIINIEHPEDLVIKKSMLMMRNLLSSLFSKDREFANKEDKRILITRQNLKSKSDGL